MPKREKYSKWVSIEWKELTPMEWVHWGDSYKKRKTRPHPRSNTWIKWSKIQVMEERWCYNQFMALEYHGHKNQCKIFFFQLQEIFGKS